MAKRNTFVGSLSVKYKRYLPSKFGIMKSIVTALDRCKLWCLSIFMVYCISCLSGIVMVHSGNQFALNYRDKIVGRAMTNDQAAIANNSGNKFKAALLDFSGNLLIGSTMQTFLGLGIIIPYLTTAYQGWIGGIVSVDANHQSRLFHARSALYYLIVFLLQTIAYSLCIGSGVRAGVQTYKINKGKRLREYRLHKARYKDVLLIYIVAIPIFFTASCIEFLTPGLS